MSDIIYPDSPVEPQRSKLLSRCSEPLPVHQNILDRLKQHGHDSAWHLPAEVDDAVVISMCPEKLFELATHLRACEEVREILERAQQRGLDVTASLAALPPRREPPDPDEMPWGG
jgi:hypothetical protein